MCNAILSHHRKLLSKNNDYKDREACMGQKRTIIIIMFFLFLISYNPIILDAQEQSKIKELEKRVDILEEYILKLQPLLEEMKTETRIKINQRVREEMDNVKNLIGKVVILDPNSKQFHKIETNTASFLLSLNNVERTSTGYLLSLHVGNPSAASYSDVMVTLRWGKKWIPNSFVTYSSWRRSLRSAEFPYSGVLSAGSWTEIVVDLSPTTPEQFQYLECEMNVSTAKLQRIKYRK